MSSDINKRFNISNFNQLRRMMGPLNSELGRYVGTCRRPVVGNPVVGNPVRQVQQDADRKNEVRGAVVGHQYGLQDGR